MPLKKLTSVLLLSIFLITPLQAVLASDETQPETTPQSVESPAPEQQQEITEIPAIPVFLFTDQIGYLGITPISETLYFVAYATSSESVHISLLNPQDFQNTASASPEAENPQITFLGLYWIPLDSSYTASTSLSGSGEGVVSSASMESLYDYYAFGETRIETGSPVEQRGYTSYEKDRDTGLNYGINRYQSGKWGRFISQDPSYLAVGDNERFRDATGQDLREQLSDPQQLNSYAYARNNPLLYIDPDGNSIYTFGQGVASPFIYAYNNPGKTLAFTAAATGLAIAAPVVAAVGGAALGGIAIGSAISNAIDAPDADTRDYYLGQTTVFSLLTAWGIKNSANLNNPSANGQTISISPERYQHVLNRHGYNTLEKNVSTFDKEVNIQQLIKESGKIQPKLQANGNLERVYNVGRNIGTDRTTGNPTSTITVITNKANSLITSFPGRPTLK